MAEQPPKTRVLTLRVGEDDHTEILRKTKEAGMTTSEFLRDVFINAKLTFNVKEPLI
ncbi:plasmid mobilization protein, partial [Pseudomonas savastanoi]